MVEDDQTIVGFAAAAADTKEFHRKVRVSWLPELQIKYAELMQVNQSETSDPTHIKVLGFRFSLCGIIRYYIILIPFNL